jgi:hypothetical protein
MGIMLTHFNGRYDVATFAAKFVHCLLTEEQNNKCVVLYHDLQEELKMMLSFSQTF